MFVALALDSLALGNYLFQSQNPDIFRTTIGLISQGLIIFLLLFKTLTYKGKRYNTIQPVFGVRYFSIRFAVIIFSLILAVVFGFLYLLNYLGINPLIFNG